MTNANSLQEKGVETAVQSIYRDLEYAKGLILRKAGKNGTGKGEELGEDDDEESWTFVGGDEPDPDLMTKKLSDGLMGKTATTERALGSKVLKSPS